MSFKVISFFWFKMVNKNGQASFVWPFALKELDKMPDLAFCRQHACPGKHCFILSSDFIVFGYAETLEAIEH